MWSCDCDGVTRDEPVDSGADRGLRAHLRAVQVVTGHRPPTCPWRAMSESIVRDVIEVAWAARDGGGALSAVLGPDPDALLVAALGVYRRACEASARDEQRLLSEEATARRSAESAARRRG